MTMLLATALACLAGQDAWLTVKATTKDGNAIVGTMPVVALEVESKLGKIKVDLKVVIGLEFDSGEVMVSYRDGTKLRGTTTIEEWKVKSQFGEMTLKAKNLNILTIMQVHETEPPDPKEGGRIPRPVEGAFPPPIGGPGSGTVKRVAMTPSKSVTLKSVISDCILTKDGSRLLLLNGSDSKVQVLDFETLEVKKEIPLAGGETCMSLAPDGDHLFCGAERRITLVSISQAKVTRKFDLDCAVTDVCALDDDRVIVASPAVSLVSASKQSVIEKHHEFNGPLVPLEGRIWTTSGTIFVGDPLKSRKTIDWRRGLMVHMGGYGAMTQVSPDGKYLVDPSGELFRLGRNVYSPIGWVKTLEANVLCTWSRDAKSAFLFTSECFIKEYDIDCLEVRKGSYLGYAVQEAIADPTSKRLTILGSPMKGSDSRVDPSRRSPVDLYRFELP